MKKLLFLLLCLAMLSSVAFADMIGPGDPTYYVAYGYLGFIVCGSIGATIYLIWIIIHAIKKDNKSEDYIQRRRKVLLICCSISVILMIICALVYMFR